MKRHDERARGVGTVVEGPMGSLEEIMEGFAQRTGLDPEGPPSRYLWTDAFAVCNYLTLQRRTGDARFRALAERLVDQVHGVLGRHRPDDARSGWISGLDEEEGARHPTAGGLRIGKPLPERSPWEPHDTGLEWDRDGQYLHYLTRWMQALSRMGAASGDGHFHRWAVELAVAAVDGFAWSPRPGERRLRWKMSVDLRRPLIAVEGAHDALDGLVAVATLRASAPGAGAEPRTAVLDGEIVQLRDMCLGRDWSTDDPLGIGGLLADAWRVAQLTVRGGPDGEILEDVLPRILDAAVAGLEAADGAPWLSEPLERRLAFRELGLAIGLRGAKRLLRSLPRLPSSVLASRVVELWRHLELGERITTFWLTERAQASRSWSAHRDIDDVMLVTALAPDEYLAA